VTRPLRVGLLFGGRSVEHEVSVTSARGVAAAMAQTALECLPIAVTATGRWLTPEASQAILAGDAGRVEDPASWAGPHLVVDPGGGGLLQIEPDGRPRPLPLDVVFPLIHGWGGEDGRLQGALDLAGVPYVGAGLLGSANGMDKNVSKLLLDSIGIPVVPWLVFSEAEYRADAEGVCRRIVDQLGWPTFVKPTNGGSSVGISRVDRAEGLAAAMKLGFANDAEVIVERAVDAREIECAVLGNASPQASVLGEIIPSREFYDYAAKYLDGTSELIIPADLDPAVAERIRAYALAAFKLLKLRGFARIDFLVERDGDRIYVNEANTLPGFTPISMFPRLWGASGMTYPTLVKALVTLALEDDRSTEPLSGASAES